MRDPIVIKLYLIRRVRFIAGLSVLLVFAAVRMFGWLEFPFFYFALVPLFEMFVNQPYPWLIRRINNYRAVFVINQIADILLITCGIHFVGGMNAFVGILAYPLVFIFTGIVLTSGRTYIMANLSFFCYALMVLAEYSGLIPSIALGRVEIPAGVRLATTLLVMPFYNIIAFFVSYLSGQLARTEKELVRSQQRFEDIAYHTKEWLWEINSENKFVYSSPVVKDILGYLPEELIGKNFYDFLRPGYREQLERLSSAPSDKKERFKDLVVGFTHHNGSEVFLEINGIPILNETGALLGYRGTSRDITQRNLAQEQLRMREALLNNILHSTEDGILVIGAQREVLIFNRRFQELWRLPEAVLASGKDAQLLACVLEQLTDPQIFLSEVQQLYQDEREHWGIVYFKDGRIFERYSRSIDLDGGQGRLWSFRDVTARNEAEQAMKRAKEYAELLLKTIPSAVFTVDINKRVTSWNQKAAEITGYKSEEVIGRECWLFAEMPCKDKCGLYADDVKKPVLGKECTIRKKDGSQLIISKNVDFVKDINGKIIGGIESFEDISSRKVSEKALRESEARFRDLSSMSTEGIMIHDEGIILDANQAFLDIIGFRTPDEIIGKNGMKVVCFTPESQQAILEHMKSGAVDHYDAQLVKPDGSVIPVETSGRDIIYRGRKGRLVYMRDITERKKSEENLKNAYEQLKVTQSQLVQAAKMSSLGLLAGGVAHEINNPLTGVLNNVQLIKLLAQQGQDCSNADFRDLLDVIEASAVRCTKITRALLDFSHSSKGTFREISLNGIAEEVIILIGHELKLQNITISKQFMSGLPFISGDPQLLQQVILDLISNAKWAIQKNLARKEGTLTIQTRYEAQNKSAVIAVHDTGIGIPRENLDKIFEPFFTTKAVGEGTGLGLSIVFNIVKQHGGTMTVESTPGVGTTFTLRLPAVVA